MDFILHLTLLILNINFEYIGLNIGNFTAAKAKWPGADSLQ